MENDILRFKELLVKNKKAEEANSKLGPSDYMYRETTYSFHICYEPHSSGLIVGNRYVGLITLDEEDILYLMNKYLPKLDKEMEDKINKIKEEYGKVS